MREIRTSGLMSGEGKRSHGLPDCGTACESSGHHHRPPTATAPFLDSTKGPWLAPALDCRVKPGNDNK